ncbi:MAG: hypothetical protein PHE29_02100 [Tissierellia bacterium]|nr:hypothetical protein [Tissierellia bacterium]
MYTARQRRMEARERRQESLHNRGITTEPTKQFPQPKNLVSGGIIKVGKGGVIPIVSEPNEEIIIPITKKMSKAIEKSIKSPKVTVIAKRGPGRPPKALTESNKKVPAGSKKKLSGTKEKVKYGR